MDKEREMQDRLREADKENAKLQAKLNNCRLQKPRQVNI